MRSERAGEELRTFSIRTASVVEHRAGDIHDVVKHPDQERRKHGNDRARAWSANEVMPSGSVQRWATAECGVKNEDQRTLQRFEEVSGAKVHDPWIQASIVPWSIAQYTRVVQKRYASIQRLYVIKCAVDKQHSDSDTKHATDVSEETKIEHQPSHTSCLQREGEEHWASPEEADNHTN